LEKRVQGDLFSSVLLPLSLALIRFSLGLGLTPADFGRIVRLPRALLVGAGLMAGSGRRIGRCCVCNRQRAPRIALQTG
jgi:hypothetical protein